MPLKAVLAVAVAEKVTEEQVIAVTDALVVLVVPLVSLRQAINTAVVSSAAAKSNNSLRFIRCVVF